MTRPGATRAEPNPDAARVAMLAAIYGQVLAWRRERLASQPRPAPERAQAGEQQPAGEPPSPREAAP